MTVNVSGNVITLTLGAGQGAAGTGVPASGSEGDIIFRQSGAWVAGTASKAAVGLGNVDNTADIDKPVSTAQAAFIAASSAPVFPVNVSATGYGETLTFENATTLTVGKSRSYRNDSDFYVRIKNFAGTILGFIPPRSTVVATCENVSNSAGVWHLIGACKMGVVANRSAPISFGSTGSIEVITIDADRQLIIGYGSSIYAVVYNKTANVWGNELLVRSGTTTPKAIKVGTNDVMIVSCNSTTGVEAVVLTAGGANGVSLTPGTVGTATLAGNLSLWGGLIQLSATQYVVSYTRATTVSATRVVSLSGTTPSIGAEDTVSGTSTPAHLYANSASTYTAVGASATFVYAKTNSVSGNTITPGTEVSTACTNANFKTLMMGTGRIALMYQNTTIRGGFISVSGTTPSISTAALSAATNTVNSGADWAAVSSTKLCVTTSTASTASYFNNLIDTAGVASAGTEISLPSGNAEGVSVLLSVSGNTVKFHNRQTSGQVLVVSTIDASGTSPTGTFTFTAAPSTITPSSPTPTTMDGGALGANVMPTGAGVVIPGAHSFSWLVTDKFVRLQEALPISTSVSKIGHSRNEAWSGAVDSGRWLLNKIEVAA